MLNPRRLSELAWLPYALSWALLTFTIAAGLRWIPNEIVGGTYSNTDGEWLVWNAISILQYGNFLDPSPYNAFSGMGSMYLPNLPWLNFGALALKLPLSLRSTYVCSYVVYMVFLSASIVVLARVLGFSWVISTIAAQLHVLVLFPPFSFFFQPMEWYSAAPFYAYLSTVLNFATALFLRIGQWPRIWTLAAAVIGLPMLAVVGLFSGPFSVVFFTAPYITLIGTLLLLNPPSLREAAWKIAGIFAVVVVVIALGFPDYLRAMMETSARTSPAAIHWDSLLSPSAWRNLLTKYALCGDPRALICNGNPVAWVQVLALAGCVTLVIFARGWERALGLWGMCYIPVVHLYAYLFAAGWLGRAAVFSTHFLSWSSYAILVIPIVAAPVVVLQRMRLSKFADWRFGVLNRESPVLSVKFSILFRFLITVFLFSISVLSLALLPVLRPAKKPLREPAGGAVMERLNADGRLWLGGRFNGYTATAWSKAVDGVDPYEMANVHPVYRYIGGRHYFDKHYRNTFTETDLWTKGIPTYEEYGQWVSRQAQTFALALFADEKSRRNPQAKMLRIYNADIDVMRAVGIRFMISDERIEGDARLTRVATQSAPNALSVHLYELRNPNLGTFSPTEPIVTAKNVAAILPSVAQNSSSLDRKVFVTTPLQGPFTPVETSTMTLVRDGYRVTAKSQGRSLLLLPIQFSHCLTVTDHLTAGTPPRLVRANFLQAMAVFDRMLDATIEFRFGLFGSASCRLEDAAEFTMLTSRQVH